MNRRTLRLAGPLSVVIVVAVVLGWFPARQSSADFRARIDSAERLVDELAWEIEDLSALSDSETDLLTAQAALEIAIPPDHDMPGLILTLQSIADDSGYELLDVVPSAVLGAFDDPDTPFGTSSIVLAVALQGEYASLITLLDRIGSDPRLMVVDAVAVGVDEVSGRLAVDLEIRVFTTRELVAVDDGFLEDFGLDEDGSFDEEAP